MTDQIVTETQILRISNVEDGTFDVEEIQDDDNVPPRKTTWIK